VGGRKKILLLEEPTRRDRDERISSPWDSVLKVDRESYERGGGTSLRSKGFEEKIRRRWPK